MARARRRGRVGPAKPVALAAGLVAVSLPVLMRAAARERDARVLWTLLAAEQARLLTALIARDVTIALYRGETDVREYDEAGRQIAPRLRAGRLREAVALARTVPWDTRLPGPIGTNLARLLTGAAYALVGPSERGASVLFSWLGFWGLFLFDRAFATAVPRGRRRAYLGLVGFTPSLSFWTSTVGKEPWVVFSLGMGALGAARTLTGSPRSGVALGASGAALLVAMRPAMVGVGVPGVRATLDDIGERSSFGGSQFDPAPLRGPGDALRVGETVLFRPHLREAHNAQAVAAAIEATGLMALSLLWLPSAATALARPWREPYVAFSAVATAILIAYLSRLSNFGMLARQRVAVLPFYFVLLSAPPCAGSRA